MTHSITLEYKTDKQLMWNYLIGFRANLEAALITDKRPKPRSDIEDAMIVVNTDVRQPWRDKQCERLTETAAGRELEEDWCQQLNLLQGFVTYRETCPDISSVYLRRGWLFHIRNNDGDGDNGKKLGSSKRTSSSPLASSNCFTLPVALKHERFSSLPLSSVFTFLELSV